MSADEKVLTRMGIVEKVKERHGHSPSIRTLADLVLGYSKQLENCSLQGQEVVWYGGSGLSPIFFACGTIPGNYNNIFRYMGDSGAVLAREEFQVPQEFCGMAQVILGELYRLKGSPIKRNFFAGSGCEPLWQVFSFLRQFGYDTFVADWGHPPINNDPARWLSYRKRAAVEIDKLAGWLGGLDAGKLQAEIIRFNRIQKKLHCVLNARQGHSEFLDSVTTAMLLNGQGNYYGCPREYEEVVTGLLRELQRLEPGEYHKVRPGFICWGGAAVSTLYAVDQSGGAIVSWHLSPLYREDIPPMEALVQFIAGNPDDTAKRKCEILEREYHESGARGVLLFGSIGCSSGSIEVELQRRYLQERGIPGLAIFDTFAENENAGQLGTRIQAFVEMVS